MSDGAQVHQSKHSHDGRVTRLIDWFLAAIGGAILMMMWRAGDTLVEVKIGIATLTERVNAKDRRDDLQDKRLDALEGTKFRGVDGYGDEPKEPRRVR